MKQIITCVGFLLIALFGTGSLFISCDLNGDDNTGIAVFNVYISGYNEEGDKTITLELKHKSTDEESTQEVPLLDDDTSSGYFSDLDSGKYDVTVAFLNDDELVGDHDFEIEVYPDETTRSRIDGVWENGEMTFEVSTVTSGDDDGDTSVEIYNINAVLMEERRYWDEPNNPRQFSLIWGEGSFDTVYGCSATFPDGYEIHFTENLRYLGGTVEISSSWFRVNRLEYIEDGVYQINLFDINELGDMDTDTVETSPDDVSCPLISSPSQGASLNGLNPIDIIWSLPEDKDIKTLFLYVIDKNNDSIWFALQQLDPSQTMYTIPGATIPGSTPCEILLFAVDKDISIPDPGEYSRDNIIQELLFDFDAAVDYIGLARLEFDT
jgi:hypothetical protein